MSEMVVAEHEAAHGSMASYTSGFVLSIIFTITAYIFVTHHIFSGWTLIFALVIVALFQMLVQLIFFLHLGRKSSSKWNIIVFLFMILVVGIVVVGSLWIMYNLDYRMMPMSDQKVNQYLNSQDGL